METTISLQGQSPAIPLDSILQAVSAASLTGVFRAITALNEKYRLLFMRGEIACVAGPQGGDDAVTVVRDLLAAKSVWGFEPMPNLATVPFGGEVNLQAVLLEVARQNDERTR